MSEQQTNKHPKNYLKKFTTFFKNEPKSFKIIISTLILLIVFILIGQHINLPYYALKPGGVYPAENLVSVSGHSQNLNGQINMVYVYESQENLITYPIDKLHSKISIYPLQAVAGTPTGNLNQQQSDVQNAWYSANSQLSAEVAALGALGYNLKRKNVGSLIGWVDPTAPAEKFIVPGDTIVQINNSKIQNSTELANFIESHRAGTKVTITVVTPANKTVTGTVKLAKLFSNSSKYGYLGVGTLPNYKIPVKISFLDSINGSPVGGPSAGLAYTLTIMDEMTGGNMLKGVDIAATGTISPGGQIGPIGGLVQKTYSVMASDAKIFFVPDGQSSQTYKTIFKIAGTKLKIYKVSTLTQVIKYLHLKLN